jgi:hypothetical protein
MADQPQQRTEDTEPRGFGKHSRGLAGEYAHEQGWGLNIEQRKYQSTKLQNADGGSDFEYGARDFGDEPVNTNVEPRSGGRTQNAASRTKPDKE